VTSTARPAADSLATAMVHVVLLRGVNTGPKNRIKMADFRAGLEDVGFGDVRTHVNSGNAVVTSELDAGAVEAAVRELLTSRFDLAVDVVVRDAGALAAIVADNPLADIATDGRRQFVVFCSEPHDPALLPEAQEPERLVARPTEIHVWCPNGVQGSRLFATLGRRPPAPVTSFRNWNTVTKLAEMAGAGA
jgi:uncharacterized protein (DUF1697 family)